MVCSRWIERHKEDRAPSNQSLLSLEMGSIEPLVEASAGPRANVLTLLRRFNLFPTHPSNNPSYSNAHLYPTQRRYVRPAALSLVRENHPNVRDAGLSLLRAVEVALDPSSISCSPSRVRRGNSSGQNGERRDRGRGGSSGGGCGSAGASGSRGGSRGTDRWKRGDDAVAGRIRDLRQQEDGYPQSVSSATTTSSSDDYHRQLGGNNPREGFGRTR